MKKKNKIIIFILLLFIFLGLIFLFNIYKKSNNYRNTIKHIEIFISPLLKKNESITLNRLRSYKNIQKEFWIKNSLNEIREKEKNEESDLNEYLEEALILTSLNRKDEAKEILKKVLLNEKDGGVQKDIIIKMKERIKSSDTEIEEKEQIKQEEIDSNLIDMLFEEFVEEQEISITKELFLKKNKNKEDTITEDNGSINEKDDNIEGDISISFYDRLKSSDEIKEFVNKGQNEEEYNIVLEVLDKAYKDKLINVIFYNQTKELIVKAIEEANKNLEEELADIEEEKIIINEKEKLLAEIPKEVKNNYNDLVEKEDQVDNLIKNGKFLKKYYWFSWADNAKYFKYSVVNGVALIDITNNVRNSHIDFYQDSLQFTKGSTYKVKFQAKASSLKDIRVAMQQMHRDWIVYHERNFRLIKNMKNYEFTFKMNNNTDNNGRLLFIFDYEKCKIYIDNVEIKKINIKKLK